MLDLYYSLEGYLKYKYFKKYEADDFNIDSLEELEKYVKVKKRIFYSMIFWNTFNVVSLRYILNCFYTHPVLKLFVYSFIIIPNIWFYVRKFKDNRIQMQKILICDYFKKLKVKVNENDLEKVLKSTLNKIPEDSRSKFINIMKKL